MLKKRVLAIVLVFTVSGFMLCQGSAYSYVKTNNNENEENIVSHEINTVVSGAAINTYSSEAMMKFKQKKVESNSIKENYIVVTKDDIGKKKIETNYDIAEISELSGYARDEDIVTLCISGDTATRLQKSEDIEYIEKDTTVFACTNRKEKVKQIRKIRKVIEKKHKKDEKAWNQQMIKTKDNNDSVKQKVKVAVLDSGIDYGNDIEYKDQINLIKGEEEVTPLFVDDSGHGTSVAGVIAASRNDKGITGINPNVELYSAKILDDKDTAPISRVVDGIYWAMQKNVNIINISFSTPHESQILEKAIKDAYNQGILIIAAAGNSESVEYPAEYPEVMAIGSIDNQGILSEFSAHGDEIDAVAPGEKITSSSLLGGTLVSSGTSMAAPHVVGVASLLWQKDLTVSAGMIRALIEYSANGYGDKEEYGEGLVDYEYAEGIYKQFKKDYYQERLEQEDLLDEYKNVSEVIVFEDDNTVEGKWSDHAGTASEYGAVKTFQNGAKAPDILDDIKGLTENHAWHGGRFCNFVADYRYLVKVARAVGSASVGNTVGEINEAINGVGIIQGMNKYYPNQIKALHKGYGYGVYSRMRIDLTSYVAKELLNRTPRGREAYVFGLASHVATDAFSHSSYRFAGQLWEHLIHRKKSDPITGEPVLDPSNLLYTDRTDCVKRRYSSACAVLVKIIDRYNNNRADIAIVRDFQIAKTDSNPLNRVYYNTQKIKFTEQEPREDATYRLFAFSEYMTSAGEENIDVLNIYDGITTMIMTDLK